MGVDWGGGSCRLRGGVERLELSVPLGTSSNLSSPESGDSGREKTGVSGDALEYDKGPKSIVDIGLVTVYMSDRDRKGNLRSDHVDSKRNCRRREPVSHP